MAALTLRPVAAIMNIVFPVTADTRIRRRHLLAHRRLMALVATQSFVSSRQLEARPRVMVKVPNLPIPRIMASLAQGPESPRMDVLFLMAGHTI